MATQEAQRRRRTWIGEAWDSNVGKKVIVAVTGIALVGYVVLHMLGNLTTLLGPGDGSPQINAYGEWLRDFGAPLLPHAMVIWVVRIILLVALIVHIVGVFQLTQRNRAARPAGYPAKRIGRSWAARTMRLTGPLLLLFIIFHILHFTVLAIDVTPLREGEIYENLYGAFQKWYFVLLYLAAIASLGYHLRHGVWSLFQTLGLDRPARNPYLRHGATALSVVVCLGFAVIPLAFFTGALPEPVSGPSAHVATEVAR
ncbi:succinate dehydrogenase cytochrome b subunit [Patulibacter americanus]|uniref:succinate dehydrogenase cytochrome b subunit n=1 Tax=Patulibacter americanus TaxID=588672 RepID=UPI00040EC138|nr:succinate dehydrogenase cytochrome b subunit [Patulibacter americanus]